MSQRIGTEHRDKKLHVKFKDGEVADLRVLVVGECDEHEDCRGFAYDLIATNRPERAKQGVAHWAHHRDVEAFHLIGD